MKKNIIISILALMIAASAVGCGSKAEKKSSLVAGNSTNVETSNTENTDNSEEASTSQSTADSQTENYVKDADKDIDMDKLDGTVAKTDKSGTKGDGKMTTCNVKIDEVKMVEIDGSNIIFVQFNYKNTSDTDNNFSGEVLPIVYQDGMELSPAVFRDEIEGYSPDSSIQRVAPGESIKVQRAYATSDASTPIEIYVQDTYDQTGENYLSQVFLLK